MSQAHTRQAPTPQPIRSSIDTWQGMPNSSATFATFRSMRDAAASRLGYAGPVRSLRTTGRVYGGLLAHSFRRAQACFDAMESRCYDGGIRFLTREKPVRAPHALVCGALTAGMVLALVCGA
mgnify:CR=1 FL=1